MTDHVHDWHVDKPDSLFPFRCKECGDGVSLGWAVKTLNATERLGAEDALMAAHAGKDNGLTEREVGRLRAYAAALDGEDD